MSYFLTGGSGVLGTELQKHLDFCAPSSKDFDITNIYPQQGLNQNQLLKWRSCDTIVHCAAFTNVPQCEVDRKKAIQSNINGTANIITPVFRKRIVYISTDYVYAGENGNYSEADDARPFNFYGWTKYAGEAFLDLEKDLIIRTSFKPNTVWKYPVAFSDLYTSADYVDVIALKIIPLIKSNLTGIINVGTKRKSIYELAKSRNPHVLPSSIANVHNVRMPSDISMNLQKLENFEKERG